MCLVISVMFSPGGSQKVPVRRVCFFQLISCYSLVSLAVLETLTRQILFQPRALQSFICEHSFRENLKICLQLFFISICTSDTTGSARALVENTSLASVHVKVSACKFTQEVFPVPQSPFTGFAIERVEIDPQTTCTAGDFFLSHISEFSPPPPKLQQMTLSVPSCQSFH